MTTKQFKLTLRTFALIGTVLGIVVLVLSIRGPSTFPERQTLAAVTGAVAWTRADRYSVDFGLAGDSRTFSYAHKSGDRATIASVLSETSQHPISILVLPDNPQQGTAGGPFFQVYEFSSNQALLRSYDQVKTAWVSDYRYGYWAALLVFLAAGFFEYTARKVPPNNSFNPMPLRGTG